MLGIQSHACQVMLECGKIHIHTTHYAQIDLDARPGNVFVASLKVQQTKPIIRKVLPDLMCLKRCTSETAADK